MELIAIKPARIELLPVNGFLAVIVDPVEVLANEDAPDMIAQVIRAIGTERGQEVLIGAACIRDALIHARLPKGHKFMFQVHCPEVVCH